MAENTDTRAPRRISSLMTALMGLGGGIGVVAVLTATGFDPVAERAKAVAIVCGCYGLMVLRHKPQIGSLCAITGLICYFG